MRPTLALAALALTMLTACGGPGGPSAADKRKADEYCTSTGHYLFTGMGLDKYANSAGYDRCVEDVLKVVACIDVSAGKGGGHFIPPNCDNDGFMPID